MKLASFIWRHPANRGKRVRTLGRALAWQLYKRATGRTVEMGLIGGGRIRCYPDSHSASLLLYASGQPDFHEMAFLRHYLRPGDCFVDVGANVGLYTVMAALLVGPAGVVEVFEPGPLAAPRLRENVALNGLGQVRVHEVVVGARAGTVTFLSDQDCENRIETARDRGKPVVERLCVTLDDVLPPRAFALGKMDIEGAEPLALAGAERRLDEANPPVWLLEFNAAMRDFGFDEEGLAAWLGARGFDLALYDSEARVLRAATAAWRDSPNVFAIARRQWPAVTARLRAS